VIARLDGMWGAHVRLHAERWERRHYQAAKSFQEAIGAMSAFDLVVGILWKRIGSPLPPDLFHRADGTPYESGTVFELESALAASEAAGKPLVYLFRKTAPVQFSANTVDEDRHQYDALLAWWKRTVRDTEGHFRRGYQEIADAEEFEQSLETLLEDHLRKAKLIPSGMAWDVRTKGSPYPGLVPYDSTYKAVFFGRALATANAVEELKIAAGREAPVLLVIGPSGSGKSSLVRAGLMPQFTGSRLADVDFWRQVLLEPAADPVLALAQRLYAENGLPELAEGPQQTPESFAALARQSPEAAAQAIKWGLERAASAEQKKLGGGRLPVGKLLLVLDQLEILLDSPKRSELAQLARALVTNETAWLIITLRSDRYEDFQRDADFVELRKRGALFDLPPPGASEIADVVKGPTRSAGLVFEERNGVPLSKVISAEVRGADALPLLQMTLAQLFAARSDNTLTYEAYEAIGGLEGAIAAHAETVFATVSPEGQAGLDALLRMLVSDIDQDGRLTVRTPDRADLIAGGATAELVDKMTEERLLVSADGTLRVAHEALLRRWQRATQSPALQPEAIRMRRQIEPGFRIWNETQLEADLLPRGTTLAAAEDIVDKHPGALPAELANYIKRSAEVSAARSRAEELRAEREARRARRQTYAVAIVALLLAALSVTIFRLYENSSRSFLLALLTRTDQYLIDGMPSHAFAMAGSLRESGPADRALAAIGLSDTQSDEAVRLNTISQITEPASAVALRTLVRESPANAADLSADGSKFAIGYGDGSVMIGRVDRAGKDTRLEGHTGRVWSVSFSPDGKHLASASTHEVLLWDLERNEAQALCGGANFTDVVFDPKGRYLAWSSRDGVVTVRNMTTSQSQSFKDQKAAAAVAFSPDGALLAYAGDEGLITVRRTDDWNLQNSIETKAVDLIDIAFSEDGKKLAAASLNGPVDEWTLPADGSESVRTRVPARAEKRWKIKYSPDGTVLAIASWDGTVSFWDAGTLQYRGTIDRNDERVNDLAFAKSQPMLLTVSESGVARFWDAAAVKPIFADTKNDSRETLVGRYSADGTKFVAGGKDGMANLYRVDGSGRLQLLCGVKHDNWVINVAFSPDASRAVSGDRGEDGVKLWNTEDCGPIDMPVQMADSAVQAIAFSPSGDQIAWSTDAGTIWLARLDGAVPPLKLPALHTNHVWELDFSPDGASLVSGGSDGKVLLWSTADGNLVRTLRDGGSAISTVRFSGGGKLIAAGGAADQIEVWDITRPQGQELVKKLPAVGGANRLGFNRDGTILGFGSDARYISMWSTSRWDKIFQLNALVGVRSIFDVHPIRGDLAFDGEGGMIRVLPRHDQGNEAPPGGAELRGMDVFFDDLPVNFGTDQDAVTVRAASPPCAMP
jgi:WD40 repeat protein/energy-coupling factor transporter ATP-binding protein EcfA2